jgi:hypothetical protein
MVGGAPGGYKGEMRFRTGLIIGLAVGYYYGTRAGRERYVQIEEWLDQLRSTTTVEVARTKLADGLREGSAVLRRIVDEATRDEGSEPVAEVDGRPIDDRTLA